MKRRTLYGCVLACIVGISIQKGIWEPIKNTIEQIDKITQKNRSIEKIVTRTAIQNSEIRNKLKKHHFQESVCVHKNKQIQITLSNLDYFDIQSGIWTFISEMPLNLVSFSAKEENSKYSAELTFEVNQRLGGYTQ